MDREVVFTVKWLNERFLFDVAARNKVVETQLKTHFKDKKSLRIVDIGSGSGNNFKHLSLCFEQNQHWTLVEHDPRLCKAAVTLLADHGRMRGYDVAQNEFSLSMLKGEHRIVVETIQINLLEVAQHINLNEVDLVSDSAVFDLFSLKQYQSFVQKVFKAGACIHSVLNYMGMSFRPMKKHDQQMIDLYEKHMLRPQEFGQGMGSKSGRIMHQHLKEIDALAASGISSWQIESGAISMQTQLIDFMEEAIPELDLSVEEKAHFEEWLPEKRAMIADETLAIQVDHYDFFGRV